MESSTDTRSRPSDSAMDADSANGTPGDGTAGTRRKLSDQQESEVTRLYAETDTPVSEISKRFGIGESSVYRVAQRHGAALRGRTATSSTPKPRAAAAEGASSTTGRGTGTRGRAAGSTGRAAASSTTRTASTPSGNGRRTGAGRPRSSTTTPAAAAAVTTTTTRRAASAARPAQSGGRHEFRVSYVAVRVFVGADMADAIRQAEAAGATDITGIVRNS